MMTLPITLTLAGVAALINFWLAFRVGRVRTAAKISIGDGGNLALTAAMRAHANFAEFTPFVVILVGVIELALGESWWLWVVAIVYVLGRVAHALGMGEDAPIKLRMIGTATTMLIMIGLAICAIVIPYLPHAVTGSVVLMPSG